MSRKTKNIITSLILVLLIGISIGTIYFAGKSIPVVKRQTNTNQKIPNGGPPDRNQSMDEDNSSNEDSSNKSKNKEDGSLNSSENTNEGIPEKPSNENSEGNSEKRTPPTRNSDNTRENNNETTDNTMNHENRPEMPNDFNFSNNNIVEGNSSIGIGYVIAFIIEGGVVGVVLLYWILSGFHKKSFKETFQDKDKIIILALATTLIAGGFTFINNFLSKKVSEYQSSIQSDNQVEASANTTVTGKKNLTSTYQSSNRDESAILVKDGGSATIENATVTKKSGKSTNTENSDFYGINSGILVQKKSSATIKKSKIKTSAKGSNAVFATGENAKVTISDSTIETTGKSSSRGLDATYGGEISADNVTITTQGDSSATLATDRGEGTVSASNSNLETNGSGSPIIYSTGDISITDTEGVANGSQMVVVEGKNRATVTNSKLSASGVGNRGDVDQAGIMIYQSMSGDADEGEGSFIAKNSTFTIQENSSVYQSAPMFFITNTSAKISLENSNFTYGSGVLFSIRGTAEWGNSGSNGGRVVVDATNQTLEGDIQMDKLSTLTFHLTSQSNYKGVINGDNEAGEVHITLDKSSKLTLMGDSYVTSLEDEDETYSNIDFNGYTLYVNGTAVK